IEAAISLFRQDLVANLFQATPWIFQSRDFSDTANGKNVNWAQAGARPSVIINRNNASLTASPRGDFNVSYELDEYQSVPNVLSWTDEYVVNYAKRQSILREHTLQMTLDASLRIMKYWAEKAAIVRTTGETRKSKSPGATATDRKKFLIDDILAAKETLKRQNIPDDGRLVMLLPATAETDLLTVQEFRSAYLSSRQVLATGSLMPFLGMNVFTTSTSVLFSNASTPVALNHKADDSATNRSGAATDNESILIWHPDMVSRGISADSLVSIIPVHGGVEMSATALAGGRTYRKDGEGIVAIVETVV
ncbi:MAG TPA: hypothetical protein DCM08_05900, partial [Microscillaceae bacterium]|nr:hypothetical protein [Microscillaceae bacterium]